MDTCHLKIAELEPQFQQYRGRVEIRGDIVKDDSRAYAVFTEQGSSASQMTAAKVMGIIARPPDCDGQASDAVSAYSGKNGGCSQIAQNSKVTMSTYIGTSSTTWMAKIMNDEDPVVLLERNLYGHPLVDLLCERLFEKVLSELKLEKVPNWEMLISASTARSILIEIHGTTSKWVERSRTWRPSGRKLMKNVDLDAPTSILVHVHLGSTQRECKLNKIIIELHKLLFESSISPGATENYQDRKILRQKLLHGPTTWKDMLKKCVERCCELTNKKDIAALQSAKYNVSHLEELESVGEFSKVCLQFVLKYL